ncbi:MAG: 2-hydroxyacyl-CoA dehydratase family protein [bacterium]
MENKRKDIIDQRRYARRVIDRDISTQEKRKRERRVRIRRDNLLSVPEWDWDKSDEKTIAWFCTYTPEEIFLAAGLKPVRIFSRPEAICQSYSLLQSNICSYVLNSLDSKHYYKSRFPKGVVICNCCDAMRRMYDVWRYNFEDTNFVYLLDLPRTRTHLTKAYYRDCLQQMVKAIEDQYQLKITDEDLIRSIRICNEIRGKLNYLCALRKEKNPPLTGEQALNVIKAGMYLSKEIYNDKLSGLISNLKEGITYNHNVTGPRILIMGSYYDNHSLLSIIKGYGGTVVFDYHCNGFNYFDQLVSEEKDPLTALCDRYLEKNSCPRVINIDERVDKLLMFVKGFSIDAVIYYSLKFCDNNLFSFPHIKDMLMDNNIPCLFIESDGTSSNIGQIKTRVQSLFEMLSF